MFGSMNNSRSVETFRSWTWLQKQRNSTTRSVKRELVTSPQKINFVALYTSTLAIRRSGGKSRAHTSHHPKGPSSHLRINNLLWLCVFWKPISFLSMKTKHAHHRRSNTKMNLVINHQHHRQPHLRGSASYKTSISISISPLRRP